MGDERELLDLVCRALDGKVLTSRTLEWFIDAFRLERLHRETLAALLSGASRGDGRVVVGSANFSTMPVRLPYRTVAVHEFHHIGADRLPARHETLQVIEALDEGVDRYVYRFDTADLQVRALRGATQGPVEQDQPGLFRVEFRFAKPLTAGETQSFAYETSFRYSQPPPPEFRRAALRRVENLEIRVEFHPNAAPAAVWWAVWPDLDGPCSYREQRHLDDDLAVHRHLALVERAVVGFQWDWPQ